jgi:hypothetical protein
MYITIGTIFHRFGNLEIYKTTDADLEINDFFSSYLTPGKNWLKIVAKDSVKA